VWRRLLKGFACCLHSGCENAARPLFLSGQIKDTFHPSGDEIKHTRGARWLASSGPGSPALPLHWAGAAFPSCPAAIAAPGHGHGVPQGALPAGFGPEHVSHGASEPLEPENSPRPPFPPRVIPPVSRIWGFTAALSERVGFAPNGRGGGGNQVWERSLCAAT